MFVSKATLDSMARGEYVRLDEERNLHRQVLERGREYGPKREAKPWERLRRLAKTPYKTTNRYLQVPNSTSAQPIVHSVASHPVDAPSHVSEHKAEAGAEDYGKEDYGKEDRGREDRGKEAGGGISIEFTHNHPCREDGEDEDLCCLWIPSSDDDAGSVMT
ncbi:hypothetical protein FPOA_13500 [Fusarium poae]|uniref:Uncharacterized protein n=1 Tax=Fusarium poae TaxID=36050 RepID=A0A1B8A5G2_FUSPO|nr:hypothetical protein FPOA_13500 [Fusarium poae]